jgi:hypothetical protein
VDVKFNCTKCGKCCTGQPHQGVRLSPSDASRIISLIGPPAYRLATAHKSDHPQLKMPNGKCVFLKDNLCMIYEARPDQCRTFPFWAGFWLDPKGGSYKKADCEGLEVTNVT